MRRRLSQQQLIFLLLLLSSSPSSSSSSILLLLILLVSICWCWWRNIIAFWPIVLHTVGSAFGICLSVCVSVALCSVAKRSIQQQKCLNEWIGSALIGIRQYNFQPVNWPSTLKPPPQKFHVWNSHASWPWLFQTTVYSHIPYVIRLRSRDAHGTIISSRPKFSFAFCHLSNSGAFCIKMWQLKVPLGHYTEKRWRQKCFRWKLGEMDCWIYARVGQGPL